MERTSWTNCLPLYFYIYIDIYDMKQMEGSAERALHLFYLSVSVNLLLTFLQAVRVQGPSLLMQGQSVLWTAGAFCQYQLIPLSRAWRECRVLPMVSISDIRSALTNAVPGACPFLHHRRPAADTRTAAFR